MIGSRRIHPRPYAWELFTIVNLLLIWYISSPPHNVVEMIPFVFVGVFPAFVGQTVGGVIVRLIVLYFRGEAGPFLRRIRTAGWISDTIRLMVVGTLMVHTYSWIKLLVPVLHPRLYDQTLWNIDQALGFGVSPTVFLLGLFERPFALRMFDWSYANIFFASLNIGFGYFLSDPSRRLRIAFTTGNTLMWIVGAWLYMLVPSLGPAYAFADVWLPYSASLTITQNFQALLMANYQKVMRLRDGIDQTSVNILFGIGAFPSLHVGFQTYAVLWMRRLWIYGEVVFGVFLLMIFLGSMITGWHYLIDGIAGLALAVMAYLLCARVYRLRRWLDLRRLVRGR